VIRLGRRLSEGPGRVFYGWWIVAVGCVFDAVKGGTYNSGFTLYFLPVLNEMNLSRAATALPFSLAKLESTLAGPVAGHLIDRFDIRILMVVGTLMSGIGFLLLAFTHSY
jgi:MFS family permease